MQLFGWRRSGATLLTALAATVVLSYPAASVAQNRHRNVGPPKLEYKPTEERAGGSVAPARTKADVLDVRDKAVLDTPESGSAVVEAAAMRERARASGAIICEAGCLGEPGSIVSYTPSSPAPSVQLAMMTVAEPAKLERAVITTEVPAANAIVCLAGCDTEPIKPTQVKMSGPYYIPPNVVAKAGAERSYSTTSNRATKSAHLKTVQKARNAGRKHRHADHLRPYARKSHKRRAELEASDDTSIEGIQAGRMIVATVRQTPADVAPVVEIVLAALSEDDVKTLPEISGATIYTGSLPDKEIAAPAAPTAGPVEQRPVMASGGLSSVVALAHKAALDAKTRNTLRATSEDWFNRASREEARSGLQ
jgi:hypothetical protein